MIFKWLKKRRDRKKKEFAETVAAAVRRELSAEPWEKFLPIAFINDIEEYMEPEK